MIAALLAFFFLCGTAEAATPSGGASADVVTVRSGEAPQVLRAYGQIRPRALIQVRVIEPGTLAGLHVVPGDAVTAGEVLAVDEGPRVRALLTARDAELRSAQARVAEATEALEVARRQRAAWLGTQRAVAAARRDLAAARAALDVARARRREAAALRTIRAPVAGTVTAVVAANGQQTTPGERLLTLLPTGALWVLATYYGADAGQLRVGMPGRFRTAGGDAVPVKIAAIVPTVADNGGQAVGLVLASAPAPRGWRDGEWGSVRIEEPARRMVSVPTRALILDHGAWWVLVHTPHGDLPQEVVPGPARGWQTWIVSGLRAGQQVVAQDAFLKFHQGIAQSYQPPD